MRVFLDIGNTNMKHYCESSEGILLTFIPTEECSNEESLRKFFLGNLAKEKIELVFISCVVPKVGEIVKNFFTTNYQIEPVFLNIRHKTNIKFDILEPRKLGPDFIALGSFLEREVGNDAGIMINLGTATTICYVKNRVFRGAIICPGFDTAKNALFARADLLSDESLISPNSRPYGRDTSEALSIGLLDGHAKMVIGLVSNIDANAAVYFSGGNAKILASKLSYKYVEEATIKGLRHLAAINEF